MNTASEKVTVTLLDSQLISQTYRAIMLGTITNAELNFLLTDEYSVQKILSAEGIVFDAFDGFSPNSNARVVFKIIEGQYKEHVLVTDKILKLEVDSITKSCMLIDVHNNTITVKRVS